MEFKTFNKIHYDHETLLFGCLARISSHKITLPLCFSQNKEKEVGHEVHGI